MAIEKVKTLVLMQHPDYIRGQKSKTYADELAQVLSDAGGKWPFPPVILQPIPDEHENRKSGSEYWIIDGTHRCAAATLTKYPFVDADVRTGISPEDAIALQIKSNSEHGLRLSHTAQVNAIKRLAEMKMPQKTIAVKTGLSQSSISRIVGDKQRPDDAEKTHGGDRTGKKAPIRFDAENWFKGLKRTLKVWEKYGTKIRKTGFPDACGKAMDTLAGKLLWIEDKEE